MDINNQLYSVPSAVSDLCLSYVPFGSDYVIYCSDYSNTSRVYICLYRAPLKKRMSSVIVTQTPGSSVAWQVTSHDDFGSYNGFVVRYPYYSISNVKGQGSYKTLPSTDSLICLMLIVIACISVLKLVFGGVKIWRNR